MDPTINLNEQLVLVRKIRTLGEQDCSDWSAEELHAVQDEILSTSLRLTELVDALDCWMRAKGSPPAQWKQWR